MTHQRLRFALTGLFLGTLFVQAGLTACSSTSEPDLERQSQALRPDTDVEPPECGDCIPNAASPKGGYMMCGTRRVACVPPAPPPPPPPTTCTDATAEDGVCRRVCCTPRADGNGTDCGALPCPTLTKVIVGPLLSK